MLSFGITMQVLSVLPKFRATALCQNPDFFFQVKSLSARLLYNDFACDLTSCKYPSLHVRHTSKLRLKQRTSNLRTCLHLYDSLPVQRESITTISTNHKIAHQLNLPCCFVISWNSSRRSQTVYQGTLERKLEVICLVNTNAIQNILSDKISKLIISYSLRDAETTTSQCNLLQIIGKEVLIFYILSGFYWSVQLGIKRRFIVFFQQEYSSRFIVFKTVQCTAYMISGQATKLFEENKSENNWKCYMDRLKPKSKVTSRRGLNSLISASWKCFAIPPA